MSGVLATVGALCILLVAVEAAASLCGDSPWWALSGGWW